MCLTVGSVLDLIAKTAFCYECEKEYAAKWNTFTVCFFFFLYSIQCIYCWTTDIKMPNVVEIWF